MKKYVTGLFVIVIGILVFFGGSVGSVLASSGTITFTSKNPEIKKGEKVSVVLTVESSAIVGDFEAYLSYDPKILEFQTGGSLVSGGDGLLKIRDVGSAKENELKKYSMSFKGIGIGACEIGLSDKAMAYDGNGDEMSLSDNRLSVTVKTTAKLSGNCDLSSLQISPGSLSPAFEKDVINYTTSVETDTLFVSATAAETKAIVDVTGNEKLKDGENKVVIKVTAPSGVAKEYTIMTTKEETVQEKTKDKEEEIQDKPCEVIKEKGKSYIKGSYQYELVNLEDKSLIPKGYMAGKYNIGGANIPIYILMDFPDSEFVLIYAKKENEKAQFYQFDLKEETIQKFQTLPKSNHQTGKGTLSMGEDEYQKRLNQLSLIIAVLTAFSILLLIIVIQLFLKKNGYEDNDE